MKILGQGVAACALLFALSACQKPAVERLTISEEDMRREGLLQEIAILETYRADVQRIHDIGYPLLKAGTPLCGEIIAWDTGVTFTSLSDFRERARPAAIEAFNLTYRPAAEIVVAGSPADLAGMKVGDRLLAFQGQPVGAHETALNEFYDAMGALALDEGADVSMRLERDGQEIDVSMPVETVCAYPIHVQIEDMVNAFADGETILFTTGIMRSLDDSMLSVIFGHELAHNVMDHIGKQKTNATMAAAPVLILEILAALGGVNTQGKLSEAAYNSALMAFSADFEAEADVVGLYIAARAGRLPDDPSQLWRRMAALSGGTGMYTETSHPPTAERGAALTRITAEIKAKVAANQPLLPDLPEDWEARRLAPPVPIEAALQDDQRR